MRELRTEADFDEAVRDREEILIRDSVSGTARHRLPCPNVRRENFVQKVVVNKGRNGSYWAIEPGDEHPWVQSARRHAACLQPQVVPAPAVASRQARPAAEPVAPGQSGATGASLRWVGTGRRAFEVWCSKQLDLESKPPEPRGVARQLIREGLRALEPTPDALLRATFRARALLVGSDVENVLFTNVDATGGAFRSLVECGLEFEFLAEDTHAGSPGVGLEYCSTYGWTRREESRARWASVPPVAEWSDVVVPDLGRLSRAPALWWILRRAPFRVEIGDAGLGSFGVELEVVTPRGFPFNAASRIKPAIDAVVLCLSAENGASSAEGLAAMAQHASAPADELVALLRDDSRAILGRHRLVDRRGQVAPPDHGCVRGRLVVTPGDGEDWRLSARVVPVG